jgi:hypothetical protein
MLARDWSREDWQHIQSHMRQAGALDVLSCLAPRLTTCARHQRRLPRMPPKLWRSPWRRTGSVAPDSSLTSFAMHFLKRHLRRGMANHQIRYRSLTRPGT